MIKWFKSLFSRQPVKSGNPKNYRNHDFFFITIRGRFAFTVCCIENAVDKFQLQDLNWNEVFQFLWRYPTGNEIRDLALWHEHEMEFIPSCVVEDLPYDKKMFEYLSKEHHDRLRQLYLESNEIICRLIDLNAWIGTQSLYGGVRDGSPVTLEYLDNVIQLMNSNNIPLPDIEFFKQFSYPENQVTDQVVWGAKINKEILSKESKWIDKSL